MKKEAKEFTEFDFFKIFISLLIVKDISLTINKNNLEEKLFTFIDSDKYSNIFNEINFTCINDHIILDDSFLNSFIYLLLKLDKNDKNVFHINLNKENAFNILSKYNEEYINTITDLIADIYENQFIRTKLK